MRMSAWKVSKLAKLRIRCLTFSTMVYVKCKQVYIVVAGTVLTIGIR